MAKRAALFPSWVQTLDAMVADNVKIRVGCDVCLVNEEVDLLALRALVGGSYSLMNRRCRCRLTPGCKGWNRFFYLHGVFRPLWDDRTSLRWMAITY